MPGGYVFAFWIPLSALAAGALVAMSGCGGDAATGGCNAVRPCGGSVVGDWQIVDSCIQFPSSLPADSFCPTGTIDNASTANLSGSISYAADLTYSLALTVSATLVVGFPP